MRSNDRLREGHVARGSDHSDLPIDIISELADSLDVQSIHRTSYSVGNRGIEGFSGMGKRVDPPTVES